MVLLFGLVVMVVMGIVMWWKCCLVGMLGVLLCECGMLLMCGWIVGFVLFGIVFLLMGLMIVVVWLFDWLLFGCVVCVVV